MMESGMFPDSAPDGAEEGDDGQGSGNSHAGIITAGEWCDLNNWTFWSGLLEKKDFKEMPSYWEFYTNNRVAINVSTADGDAVEGAKVELIRSDATIWTAVTDNKGNASCWVSMFQNESSVDGASLSVKIDGVLQSESPVVSTLDVQQSPVVNEYVVASQPKLQNIVDIAFVVDATGSMGDEIEFLKEDLQDIVGKICASDASKQFYTGTVFYRDKGDQYITRFSQFTSSASKTAEFIADQRADGGGDYPEAVHDALKSTIQDLAWVSDAKCKIAFLLLDAPAHHEDGVIKSLHESITLFAEQGIRIIPIAASGVDKSTEFMLRFFAIATGGTYTFITNHSGYGNDHIEASVGEYKVEQLNDLIVRLVNEYSL